MSRADGRSFPGEFFQGDVHLEIEVNVPLKSQVGRRGSSSAARALRSARMRRMSIGWICSIGQRLPRTITESSVVIWLVVEVTPTACVYGNSGQSPVTVSM